MDEKRQAIRHFSSYRQSYNTVRIGKTDRKRIDRNRIGQNIMSAESNHTPPHRRCPIVFFDGVCGLCNHSVNWLLARDPGHRLRFAPLQGATAQSEIPDDVRERLDTIVFLRDGRTFVRTAAVTRILMTLGGRWWLLGSLMWIIPFPIRDLGYRVVSRLRYRLFGKHDACRIPTPAERAVFLD